MDLQLAMLIASACLYGNSNGCDSAGQSYIKYYHLDQKAQYAADQIKRAYPSSEYTGTLLLVATQKKYKGMVYKNIGFDLDYSDIQHPKDIIFFKYGF